MLDTSLQSIKTSLSEIFIAIMNMMNHQNMKEHNYKENRIQDCAELDLENSKPEDKNI